MKTSFDNNGINADLNELTASSKDANINCQIDSNIICGS